MIKDLRKGCFCLLVMGHFIIFMTARNVISVCGWTVMVFLYYLLGKECLFENPEKDSRIEEALHYIKEHKEEALHCDDGCRWVKGYIVDAEEVEKILKKKD